jgi:hypothetical protein
MPSRTTLPPWKTACLSRRSNVSDLLLLGLGLGFFAISVLYAVACDHL